MARTINESSNYNQTITSDGTDTGTVIGSMSATVSNSGNRSISITAVLTQGTTTLPADSVIQSQLTDFIAQIRDQANTAGLTQFGIAE